MKSMLNNTIAAGVLAGLAAFGLSTVAAPGHAAPPLAAWPGPVQMGGSLPYVSVKATDGTAGEPGTGKGSGTFTFTRTGSTAQALKVNHNLGGGATPGSDYTPMGYTVTIPAGSGAATKTVSVMDDREVEWDETVEVTLLAGSGYLIDYQQNYAKVTISDDDKPVVSVSASDPSAGEPGTGKGTGTFTFTRTGSTAGTLTVVYTVGGTAKPDRDYSSILLGTSVIIPSASATATKTVSVVDDKEVEASETVVVTLRTSGNYTVGDAASATVTIQDDERH